MGVEPSDVSFASCKESTDCFQWPLWPSASLFPLSQQSIRCSSTISLPFTANFTPSPPLSLSLNHRNSVTQTHLYFLSLSISDVARAIELLEKLQESGDVPGHKLQSLKKVLQSEFCTAIREVRPILSIAVTSRV